MQFRTLLVSLLTAATATAQTTTSPPAAVSTNLVTLVQQLPRCALSCLSQGAAAINCNPANFSCLCSNSASLLSNIGACVLLACSSDDTGKLSSLTTQICAVVNANPNPTQVSSASVIVASAIGSASTSKSSNIARATDAPALGVMGGAAVAFVALAL